MADKSYMVDTAQLDNIYNELKKEVSNIFAKQKEWSGFHWPGYYDAHIPFVERNSIIIFRGEIGKKDNSGKRDNSNKPLWCHYLSQPNNNDDILIEHELRFASLLHDIKKLEDDERHAILGAEEGGRLLREYGLDSRFISSVESIIRSHVINKEYDVREEGYPLANKCFYDADSLASNFGMFSLIRYFLIRAKKNEFGDRIERHQLEDIINNLDIFAERKREGVNRLVTRTGKEFAEMMNEDILGIDSSELHVQGLVDRLRWEYKDERNFELYSGNSMLGLMIAYMKKWKEPGDILATFDNFLDNTEQDFKTSFGIKLVEYKNMLKKEISDYYPLGP